jgi:hypothetical protein
MEASLKQMMEKLALTPDGKVRRIILLQSRSLKV